MNLIGEVFMSIALRYSYFLDSRIFIDFLLEIKI